MICSLNILDKLKLKGIKSVKDKEHQRPQVAVMLAHLHNLQLYSLFLKVEMGHGLAF